MNMACGGDYLIDARYALNVVRALCLLLVRKGIITKEECLGLVVDMETKTSLEILGVK